MDVLFMIYIYSDWFKKKTFIRNHTAESMTQYSYHFPNTWSYAPYIWRGVVGTPNWAQTVMTICVVLFRGNEGYVSSPDVEKIFISQKGRYIYIFKPIGTIFLSLNGEIILQIFGPNGPYSNGAENGSFPRMWWFFPLGFPAWRFWRTRCYARNLLSLQLCVTAWRGVLGGDPCALITW